jgi:predicted NBD/HSP70 family sugar kinase
MQQKKQTTRDLRRSNRKTVIKKLYFDGPLSRLDLSEITGLSPATVTNVMTDLIEENIVQETGTVAASEGGRPRTFLAINPSYGYFAGVDLGETHIQIELFDLTLHNLGTLKQKFSQVDNRPEDYASWVITGINNLIHQAGIHPKNMIGVGIGVPGIVEQNGGVSIFSPNWSWQNVHFKEMLSDQLPFSICLDNGAKAMALAESRFGAGRGIKDVAVLLIGTGVGAGIITEGSLYRGVTNSAGEWGHTKIVLGGRSCRCGSRGCLEAYVGAPGIISTLNEIEPHSHLLVDGDQMATIDNLLSAAKSGDSRSNQVLLNAVQYLGVGIANIVNLVNPEKILLGGWLGLQIGDYLLQEITSQVNQFSLPQPISATQISLCQLGQDAICLGAANLALEDFLEGNINNRSFE